MYNPPTPPRTSPGESYVVDMGAYQKSLASSTSGPLQVIGEGFGGSALTWPPMELASVNDDLSLWSTGFDLAESASLFAYNSVFGTPPPNTDADTPPLYLLQSPASTVNSDPHVSLDIPNQYHAIDDHTALMELSRINVALHAPRRTILI